MSRIWSEPYNPDRHRNPMRNGWDGPATPAVERYWRAPTLSRHRVLFVQVCGFTFEFHGPEQLAACLAFYAQRHRPTSRLPVADGSYGGDHAETQRWFERLPLYLLEEPKRLQVVAALEAAQRHHLPGDG